MWSSPDENIFPKPAARVCREPTGAAESFKLDENLPAHDETFSVPVKYPQQRCRATSIRLSRLSAMISNISSGGFTSFLVSTGHFLK